MNTFFEITIREQCKDTRTSQTAFEINLKIKDPFNNQMPCWMRGSVEDEGWGKASGLTK